MGPTDAPISWFSIPTPNPLLFESLGWLWHIVCGRGKGNGHLSSPSNIPLWQTHLVLSAGPINWFNIPSPHLWMLQSPAVCVLRLLCTMFDLKVLDSKSLSYTNPRHLRLVPVVPYHHVSFLIFLKINSEIYIFSQRHKLFFFFAAPMHQREDLTLCLVLCLTLSGCLVFLSPPRVLSPPPPSTPPPRPRTERLPGCPTCPTCLLTLKARASTERSSSWRSTLRAWTSLG